MAATWGWTQENGASGSSSKTDLGASGNLFNFKGGDTAGTANYTTSPVVAGTNSFDVWLLGKFTSTFNKVDNMQFWQSTDFSPNTGLSVKWSSQAAYRTPSTAATYASATVPTTDPGTANVSIGGQLTGSLTASGYSDYIVLQLQSTTAAAAGDTSLATFTTQYDES
jgi:hypothetical protein